MHLGCEVQLVDLENYQSCVLMKAAFVLYCLGCHLAISYALGSNYCLDTYSEKLTIFAASLVKAELRNRLLHQGPFE